MEIREVRAENELELLRSRDVDAFGRLYRQVAPGLLAYLQRLSGSREVAEDLLQDTFLAALGSLGGFRGGSSVRTWLYTIATNKFRDHLRNRWGAVDIDSENLLELPCAGDSPLEEAVRKEEWSMVYGAVMGLPPVLRAALLLVAFGGMKYREAAEVLGVTLATVRMRVHRAHGNLVQALEGK